MDPYLPVGIVTSRDDLSHDQAQAALTAPGQLFEMTETSGGVRIWQHAPATFRAMLETTAFHGDKTFVVYEDERLTYLEFFHATATLAHALRDEFGARQGRPGGHRHAQLPGVDRRVLGRAGRSARSRCR